MLVIAFTLRQSYAYLSSARIIFTFHPNDTFVFRRFVDLVFFVLSFQRCDALYLLESSNAQIKLLIKYSSIYQYNNHTRRVVILQAISQFCLAVYPIFQSNIQLQECMHL